MSKETGGGYAFFRRCARTPPVISTAANAPSPNTSRLPLRALNEVKVTAVGLVEKDVNKVKELVFVLQLVPLFAMKNR